MEFYFVGFFLTFATQCTQWASWAAQKVSWEEKICLIRGFMRHFCAGVINICTLRHVEYNFFLFGFLLALLVFCSFFFFALKGNEKKLPAVCGILNILYVHYPNRTKRQEQQGNANGNGKGSWEQRGENFLSQLILTIAFCTFRLDFSRNYTHCNASLLVNDTLAMSGDQPTWLKLLPPRLHTPEVILNTWLHLGGAPQAPIGLIIELPPAQSGTGFTGCLHTLRINGQAREIFG